MCRYYSVPVKIVMKKVQMYDAAISVASSSVVPFLLPCIPQGHYNNY